jgi:hypothetical protein
MDQREGHLARRACIPDACRDQLGLRRGRRQRHAQFMRGIAGELCSDPPETGPLETGVFRYDFPTKRDRM